jgi:hypothetical protein
MEDGTLFVKTLPKTIQRTAYFKLPTQFHLRNMEDATYFAETLVPTENDPQDGQVADDRDDDDDGEEGCPHLL